MFIKTIKIKKPTAAVAAMLLIIAAIAAVVLMIVHKLGSPVMYELKTEADRQKFLKEMGWQVAQEYENCRVVIIPEDFNAVYKKYNELQGEQGFDLEKYKGKTVEIYSYPVYNYEGYEDKDCIKCNLIICDGILIGGDVCSVEIGGFMQGLRKN